MWACGDNLDGNRPPIATGFSVTTKEDLAVTRAVDATDPDGDALEAQIPLPPSHGNATASGLSITYTPAPDFHGVDQFDVIVTDGLDEVTVTIDVTIESVNDAPFGVADTLTTDEDTPRTVPISTLLANDTDNDGDTLTLSSVGSASHGRVDVDIDNGDVIFTPDADFNGDGGFVYTVTDGIDIVPVNVTVIVGPVNDPPIAVDDAVSTDEDTDLVLSTADLTANDIDPEGAILTIDSVGNPVNGSVVLAVGGDVTFTPDANFNGTASFEYTVSDGIDTDVGLVTVDVVAVNDPPIAVDDGPLDQTGAATAYLISDLVSNDSDGGDGGPLTITAVANVSAGTATLDATSVTYTPPESFTGLATFEYTLSDGTDTDTGVVTINVTAARVCGDGVVELPETCDDNNTTDDGNGCSATCDVQTGFSCTGAPSTCAPICGDGLVVGTEPCDDQNADETDGCTSLCIAGVVCTAAAIGSGDRFAVDPATGHCYVSFDGTTETFADAELGCEATGGYLATITSSAENTIVDSVQNTSENPWIGATDDAVDNDDVFDWVTDEAFTFKNFASGEPDDDVGTGGNGECLHIADAAGGWGDTNCDIDTFVVGRICELEPNPCGDSVLQAGEECDDGNTADGDGCSSTCTLENLVRFSFTGAAGNEVTFPADGASPVPGLAAIPDMSRGAGVNPASAANTFSSNNWSAVFDATEFYSFTLTPDVGASMTLQVLDFSDQRSGTGPTTYFVRSSLDGFTADLQTDATLAALGPHRVLLDSSFAGLSAPVEFRLFATGASAGTGTWRIDDVAVSGFTIIP